MTVGIFLFQYFRGNIPNFVEMIAKPTNSNHT